MTQDLTAVGANPYSDTDLADYYSGLDYIGTFQLSTSAYPENAAAKSGDPVPIVFRDRMDQPVFDILWTDEDYRRSFEAVGLRPLEVHRPLARDDDPDPWVSEREIPPFVIYVLSASRGK